MVFPGHHLTGRRPLGTQLSVEPVQGRRDRRVLVAEPLDQLDCERPGQGGVVQTTQDVLGVLRWPTAQPQQAVRQLVGLGARLARADDQQRQPP